MEEVPDEQMPNGEIPIDHSIEAREDPFRIIRGGCYIPFHSSDSDPIPGLILGSVICHRYYISRNYSLSFHITSLCYLFTLVSDRKPDNRLFLVFKLSYFCL